MPYTPAPLLSPAKPPAPVLFDWEDKLITPPLAPISSATLYAGVDLASMQSLGSITNFSYTASNQSQYANWPIINYPITTSATNYNYIYNYQFGAQINPTAQIYYNYAPDPTGQYQYICTPA